VTPHQFLFDIRVNPSVMAEINKEGFVFKTTKVYSHSSSFHCEISIKIYIVTSKIMFNKVRGFINFITNQMIILICRFCM
jgi:hypothetical protein